jgi:hypothetical protein
MNVYGGAFMEAKRKANTSVEPGPRVDVAAHLLSLEFQSKLRESSRRFSRKRSASVWYFSFPAGYVGMSIHASHEGRILAIPLAGFPAMLLAADLSTAQEARDEGIKAEDHDSHAQVMCLVELLAEPINRGTKS